MGERSSRVNGRIGRGLSEALAQVQYQLKARSRDRGVSCMIAGGSREAHARDREAVVSCSHARSRDADFLKAPELHMRRLDGLDIVDLV